MTTERPESRNLGFRVFVFLAVLANLILTIALISQVREVQQRVENLPPDLASKRDVAALRPLQGAPDSDAELRRVSQHAPTWNNCLHGAGGNTAHHRAFAKPHVG